MDDLLPQAFAVDGEYDPTSGPPTNGIEYLRHVRWEASRLPNVNVAQVDPRQFDKKQTFFVSTKKSYSTTLPELLPSPKWQKQFMEDFLQLREKVLKLRMEIPSHLQKQKLPGKNNKQAWIKFCFGSSTEPDHTSPPKDQPSQMEVKLNAFETTLCEVSTIPNVMEIQKDEGELNENIVEDDEDNEDDDVDEENNEDNICEVSNKQKTLTTEIKQQQQQQQQQQVSQSQCVTQNQVQESSSLPTAGSIPLLGTVLQLDDATTTLLVNYLIEWLEDNELNEERIAWLFSLLLVLDKPLDADTAASLQSLLRKCCATRAKLTNPRDSILAPLNILITIITKFYGQIED